MKDENWKRGNMFFFGLLRDGPFFLGRCTTGVVMVVGDGFQETSWKFRVEILQMMI